MTETLTADQWLAKAELHQANGESSEALEAFLAAAEADPSSDAAHHGVIQMSRMRFTGRGPDGDTITDEEAMEAAEVEVIAKYRALAEADPQNLAIGFALVKALQDPVEIRAQLESVLSVDPDHAAALSRLSVLAQKSGDNGTHQRVLKKAADAHPDNAHAAVDYVWSLHGEALRAGIEDIVARFGDDKESIARMAMVSDRLADPALTRRLRERSFAGGRSALWLADAAGYDDPAGVCDFLAAQPLDEETKTALAFVTALAEARNADDLIAIKAPMLVDAVPLQARVIAALADEGRTAEATEVAIDAIVEHTSARLWDAVEAGGLDRDAIFGEVTRKRIEASITAAPLDLPHAITGEPVGLDSRKGKVVLLNFFYPGCWPCRNEFGYLSPAYDAYADKPFEIISINVATDEAALVPGFMSGNGYRFTPVQGDWDWATEAYDIDSCPMNMLIDHEGRQIDKPHIQNTAQTADFCQLVDELLAVAKA